MERAPNSVATQETAFSHDEAIDAAILTGHAELERRLGCTLSEAPALERVAVTTALLTEIDGKADNRDRFLAEVYAGVRKLAELELDFQAARQKLQALYQ